MPQSPVAQRVVQLDAAPSDLPILKRISRARGCSVRDLVSDLLRLELAEASAEDVEPRLPEAPRKNIGARVSMEEYRRIRWLAARCGTTMHRLCYGLFRRGLDRLGGRSPISAADR